MKSLFNQDSESDEELIKSIDKTNELLNPEAKPTLAEKTFKALSGNHSQGNQGKSERNGIGGFESHDPDKFALSEEVGK